MPKISVEPVREPFAVSIEPRSEVALVSLPGGEFMMGSMKGDSDERPVHKVRLAPFQIGKFAVTNQEYQQFLEAHPKVPKPPLWGDSQFNDPAQPVVGVTWDEAVAFCRWAGGRLPTEAEWEYACRANNPGEFCFGNDERRLPDYAVFNLNSGGRPARVGSKKPNDWGLYDLHGNVWEWCADGKREFTAEPVENPVGPGDGAGRVLRGGGFWYGAWICRSASRFAGGPGNRGWYWGFRLAAGQPAKSEAGRPD